MRRYGQQTITLKDMLIEHLLEHLDDGMTFDALKKAVGASDAGLRRLIEEMEKAGELIRVRKPLPVAKPVNVTFERDQQEDLKQTEDIDLMESPEAKKAVSEYVEELLERHRTRTIIPPVQLTHDELDCQVDTDRPVKVIDVEPAPSDVRSSGYSVGISIEGEIDHQTGDFADASPMHEEGVFQEELLSQEAIEQVVSMAGELTRARIAGAWNVTRSDEVFKLSPRMWIEAVAEG